ncbi:hypothetical protein FOL46_007682 [Perkinsus olseni]|uniref:Protein kinase domain-containing protein n=1 Tax=Perkinsus olseni TaxID=32597 RepID=A0A7J6MNM2_PEROL|nr:hypothetical protein FOL46_007682 [Perkinsus olseni]
MVMPRSVLVIVLVATTTAAGGVTSLLSELRVWRGPPTVELLDSIIGHTRGVAEDGSSSRGASSVLLRLGRAVEACFSSQDVDCTNRMGKAYGWELSMQEWILSTPFGVPAHVHLHTLPVGDWLDALPNVTSDSVWRRMAEKIRIVEKYTPEEQQPILVVSDSCEVAGMVDPRTQHVLLYEDSSDFDQLHGCPPDTKVMRHDELPDDVADVVALGRAEAAAVGTLLSLEAKVKPGGVFVSCCITSATEAPVMAQLLRYRNGGEVYIAPPGVFWWEQTVLRLLTLKGFKALPFRVSVPPTAAAGGVFSALADFVSDQGTLNAMRSPAARKASEGAADLLRRAATLIRDQHGESMKEASLGGLSVEDRFYENLRLLTHSLSHYHCALTTGEASDAAPLSMSPILAPNSTAPSTLGAGGTTSSTGCHRPATAPAEGVIMDILASSTVKSDEELNRRLDDLVASSACDVTPTVNRSGSLDVLMGRNRDKDSCPRSPTSGGITLGLLQEGQHSDHYTPRAPRLPGYPDPPPDEWGDWDEYRDDRDPGYRVRDVEESELMREIAQKERRSAGRSTGHQDYPSSFDRREPSAEAPTGMDDDELLLAHSAAASTIDKDPAASRSSDRSSGTAGDESLVPGLPLGGSEPERPPSPSFGASAESDIPRERPPSPPRVVDSSAHRGQSEQESRISLRYDAYGRAHEVTVVKAEVTARHDAAMWRRNNLIYGPPRSASRDDFYPLKWHREPSLEAIPTVGSKTMRTPPRVESCTYDVLPLNVVYERNRTGFEETKEFQVVTNMVIAARYRVTGFLGSAAFSKAVQAWDMRLNQHVCMKIIKNDKDFFDQSLDEIKLLSLLQLNAPDGDIDKTRCLRMIDYFYHKEHLIIVTELLRDNLYEFSKLTRVDSTQPLPPVPAFGSPLSTPTAMIPDQAPASQYFTIGRLQKITHQVLTALEYIHSMGLMHCDLKPENILLQSYTTASVKVIDFGSSCFITDHLATYIQSRCYRAPEVILGLSYDTSIDIWSLGCIVSELWTSTVLFQNDSIQSLLARVVGIIGPFPEHMMRLGKLIPRYFTRDRQIYMEHLPTNGMKEMNISRSASWGKKANS